MKKTKILLITGISIVGFALQSFAQETLPEVTVLARNYKYLKAVNSKGVAQPVKLLQQKAAAYDVKNSEYYDDDYDNYSITFYLPEGYILAAYDQQGKLVRTAERYKQVALPLAVRNAIATRYPNWTVSKNIYLVNFEGSATAKKVYKLILQNGDKNLRIKTNENGEFL